MDTHKIDCVSNAISRLHCSCFDDDYMSGKLSILISGWGEICQTPKFMGVYVRVCLNLPLSARVLTAWSQGSTRVLYFHNVSQGSKKTFFMDKPRACGLWNGQALIFFRQDRKKSPKIKILLVSKLWFWWVHYHLRTVIGNPRRNV